MSELARHWYCDLLVNPPTYLRPLNSRYGSIENIWEIPRWISMVRTLYTIVKKVTLGLPLLTMCVKADFNRDYALNIRRSGLFYFSVRRG